jgi:hypothetical protein
MAAPARQINVLCAIVADTAGVVAIWGCGVMCRSEIGRGIKVFMTDKAIVGRYGDRRIAIMTGAATKHVDIDGVVVPVKTFIQG